MKESDDLRTLFACYQTAMEEYENAHGKAQEASGAETRAVNKLSDAQKAIDLAVEKIRAGAPWNTNWHHARKSSKAAA